MAIYNDTFTYIQMTLTTTQKAPQTTLSGSVTTVLEYLEYAIHSLLYQRGLYPPDGNTPKNTLSNTHACRFQDCQKVRALSSCFFR